MKISEYYDLPDFDPNNLSEAKIKHYIDIIKQKYITYWQHTIHHSKKLQFYTNFIHHSLRPRWITPSEICLILHILRKPNSLIA